MEGTLIEDMPKVIILFVRVESEEDRIARKKAGSEYYQLHKEEYKKRYQLNREKILQRAKDRMKNFTPEQRFYHLEHERMRQYFKRHGDLTGFKKKYMCITRKIIEVRFRKK